MLMEISEGDVKDGVMETTTLRNVPLPAVAEGRIWKTGPEVALAIIQKPMVADVCGAVAFWGGKLGSRVKAEDASRKSAKVAKAIMENGFAVAAMNAEGAASPVAK
jgi:hypothetical protein